MKNVLPINHPLCSDLLGKLRDIETEASSFRLIVKNLTYFLAVEATRDLNTTAKKIRTPVAEAEARSLSVRVGLFPILRAGLYMADPILDLIPSASTYHLGMYRNEETAEPVEYYNKLEEAEPVEFAFIMDPMLATGGSASLAIKTLRRWGVPKIKMLSLIASQEGIGDLATRYPDIDFHCCVIDPILNQQKYILPGLGDAGDRIFNT